MEMITNAIASADVYLIAASGLLIGLAGIAKLTKTKKDDKYIAIAIEYVNKAKSLFSISRRENTKNKKTK